MRSSFSRCERSSRFYPPDRQVLTDITLAFYPGAKIGVIGSNGSGKSSLLRIMAGTDDGYTGDAQLTRGFTVGHLEQEPQLDPTKDVVGNVMDGLGDVAGLLGRYDAVLAGWAEPDADYEKLGEQQAQLEKKSRPPARGICSAPSTSRWTRCACPRPMPT